MRSITATTAVLVLGLVGLAMTNDRPSATQAPRPAPPRRVSVRLLGPAEKIMGVAVPAHILAGNRPRFFQIDEPLLITVDLPDGKKISLPVKSAFINTQIDVRTNSAVVVDVDLLPLPDSVPYREAVAELRRLMRAMGVEPDDRMRKQMAGWPDDVSTPAPGFELDLPSPTYSAGMELDEVVGLGVNMRPTPDGGFYLALTFAASVDSRRPLWDPNFKPESKPSAEEKDKAPNPDPKKK